MDLAKYAALFLNESREHLNACNQLLLEWERAPETRSPVGGLFRAVHTIKGMAATMGYAGVADLAHRLENLLDGLRGAADLDSNSIVTFTELFQHVSGSVRDATQGRQNPQMSGLGDIPLAVVTGQ